jgi:hypothetical protein
MSTSWTQGTYKASKYTNFSPFLTNKASEEQSQVATHQEAVSTGHAGNPSTPQLLLNDAHSHAQPIKHRLVSKQN